MYYSESILNLFFFKLLYCGHMGVLMWDFKY